MEPLLAEFPPVSKAGWLAKIQQDLKGKPLEELQFRLGKLSIDPFPHAMDLQELPAPLPAVGDWEIAEDIPASNILQANRTAHEALTGGVQALRFLLDENPGAHRMESLLEGIVLDAVSIHFYEKNKNARPLQLLHQLGHVAVGRQTETSSLQGSVNWAFPDAVVAEDAAELVELAGKKLPACKVLPVDAGRFFAGEDSVVAELANTIAESVRWLDLLEDKGIPAETANSFLQFSISIGKNYFVAIAKLRALRHLWANVLKVYGLANLAMPPIEVHLAPGAQTRDANYNMIQSATQAMAAVIGGADRLTILPADAFQGESTSFFRRMARNVQHILKMESHLDWVSDPAAGSYFIEDLTLKIAQAAWQEFQRL